MTYEINTLDQLDILPPGSKVETSAGKRTKTGDGEWDFLLSSEQVLEEGDVIGFSTGDGKPKPKPEPVTPEGDAPEDAMAKFKAALAKKAEERLGSSGPSQFDDDPHEHAEHMDGLPDVVSYVVSVHGCGGSMLEAINVLHAWAVPSEALAEQLADELNKILDTYPGTKDRDYYVDWHPLKGFHTLPIIAVPGAPTGSFGIDLGPIVQELSQ